MKKMKNMKERILSIVLAFTMVLSLCTAAAPVQVRAEENAITIISQPEDTTVTAGNITESLTVEATTTATGGAIMFQWYSCDANGDNAVEEIGATTDTFVIPADLVAGEYFYYCEVGVEDGMSVLSDVATVTVENAVVEDEPESIAENGDSSCNHTDGLVFNSLDTSTSNAVYISEDATYYLTDDYEFVSRPIVIDSGCTVVICTNGYNISNSESYIGTYLFKVSLGAKLIIKNCNAEKESEITASLSDSVAGGSNILCGGILEVHNVTLKNVTPGTRPEVIGIDGQNAGEIYLYDSTIASIGLGISNINDQQNYGTVTAENCKFEMTDPTDPSYWFGFRSLDKVVLKGCTVTGDIIAEGVQCLVFEECELNCNDFEQDDYAAIGIKNYNCEEASVIKNCTLTAPKLGAIKCMTNTNESLDSVILLEDSIITAKEGIKLFECGSAKLYCTIKGETSLAVEEAHMIFYGDVVLDMEEAELQQSEMKVGIRYESDLPESVDSQVLLALCPSDYTSYFTAYDAGVYVYSEPNGEKYNLYLGRFGFTQQPTSENPTVNVNSTKDVSYQWYSAKETETIFNDTNTMNHEAGLDNYAGNNKWNGYNLEGYYVYFGAEGAFKAGDKLVVEWDDAVSGQFAIVTGDAEVIPISEADSSLIYKIKSMTEMLQVMLILDEGYESAPVVTAKLISNEMVEPVEGQNSNTLKQGSKGGIYTCVATWNKGSDLEFSANSDFITLTDDIVSGDGDEPGGENPPVENPTPEEPSGETIYDSNNQYLYHPNYTYNEETGKFTIILEAPKEGYEYRYFEYSGQQIPSTIDQLNPGGYSTYFGMANSTVTNNSFEVDSGKMVALFYCPTNASEFNSSTCKGVVFTTESDGSIYGGADRNGTDYKIEIDNEKLSTVVKNGKLITLPKSEDEYNELMSTLKEAIKIPKGATYHTGGDGIYLHVYDEENQTLGEQINIFNYDKMVEDEKYVYTMAMFGQTAEPVTVSQKGLSLIPNNDGGDCKWLVVYDFSISNGSDNGSSTPSYPYPGGSGGGSSSGSTTGGTQITVPVKNPETTVNVTAKVEENKATVDSIKNEDLAKVTDTKEETTIEIDLTGLDKTIDTVVIPTESMEKVAQAATDTTNKVEGLTIKLSTATVTLDAKALSAVVGQADGDNIQLNVDDVHTARLNNTQMKAVEKLDVHKGVEAYFTCNGKRIGDFKGGEVTVELPFEVPAGYKPEGFSVWYVDDKGNTTKYKSTYKDGKLSFVVDHFSDFIVVYDAADAELATIKENTTFRYLRLKGKKATKNSITLEWNKVADADGYIVYGNKCNANGKKYTLKKIKTIKDADTTKLVVKDLKKGTYYKYYVKAYKLVDGEKVFLGKSKVVHVTTTGGKYGNAKAVQVNKTEVSLKVGKTFTIKAKQIKEDKKIAGHTDIKYESSNSAVAKVNKNGKITAKKKGTATIYVYAQNGIYKKVKVTVK